MSCTDTEVRQRRALPLPLVSNHGRVQNAKGFRYRPKANAQGYALFKTIRVHRMVHILFNDPSMASYQAGDSVDHKDGDRMNNHHSNLRWASTSSQRANQKPRGSGMLRKDVLRANRKRDNSVLRNEEWRTVVGGAEVSNLGRFKAAGNSKMYFPKPSESGYVRVGVNNKVELLHRLILLAFVGEPPSPQHNSVDHIDRDRSNNCVSNLRWTSPKEQCANKALSRTSHLRPVELQEVGSEVWLTFPNAVLAAKAHLLDSCEVTGVANPKSKAVTCGNAKGQRFRVRYSVANQCDEVGEEWKPVIVADWLKGGCYQG